MAIMEVLKKNGNGHRFRFFRLGGFDQVMLDSGRDIAALGELDPKLWTALACPVKGLEFDEKTLALMDTDDDGRIRVPEVIEAARLASSLLKNPDDLVKRLTELPLDSIKDDTEEGRAVLASAREILKTLENPDATSISAEDIDDVEDLFAKARFNGDGIVPVSAVDDPNIADAMKDILNCVGGETDRSGELGLSRELLYKFFDEAEKFLTWRDELDRENGAILILGEETRAAHVALMAVKNKIEDYFIRCRLAGFDAEAAAALNLTPADYEAISGEELSASLASIARFPLAPVAPGRPLPMFEGVSPAFLAAMKDFSAKVVVPLVGPKENLTEEEFFALAARFGRYEESIARRTETLVEKLGRKRVREIIEGGVREAIISLIEMDESKKVEFEAVSSVKRLVRYTRDLHRLLINFVSFAEFYKGLDTAVFQAGTLYIDAKALDLCVKVSDMAKHGALAGLSRMYLAYCDCTRKGSDVKMTIAGAVTNGDGDQLMVGRNGVFYDKAGNDWDATIVKIVEHPISIRQAFFAPYKRIARMISEQVEKFAAAKDKAVGDAGAAKIADAGKKAEDGKLPEKPAAGPAPFDVARFAGIFAAIGLAVGAIGTALAALASGFLALSWWKMPIALIGIILAVSGPSMLMAWMKLRQRNLGPLLDASGWAVNTRAKINLAFGHSLTSMAELPPGSERLMNDPYAEKKHTGAYWTAGGLLAVFALAMIWLRWFAK